MKPTKEQLELVDKQVKRLVAGESYYGKMYREMGITEIKSEEDFYDNLRRSEELKKGGFKKCISPGHSGGTR